MTEHRILTAHRLKPSLLKRVAKWLKKNKHVKDRTQAIELGLELLMKGEEK